MSWEKKAADAAKAAVVGGLPAAAASVTKSVVNNLTRDNSSGKSSGK